MRDKLIELIQNAVGGCARHWAELIADHLLSNGVSVPNAVCPNCNGKGYNVIMTGDRNDYCGVANSPCPDCGGKGKISVPMTNGDRIRAMSDEELAYNFEYSTICGRIQNSNPEWCGTNGECRNCVLRWLKQPAEADHDTN